MSFLKGGTRHKKRLTANSLAARAARREGEEWSKAVEKLSKKRK